MVNKDGRLPLDRSKSEVFEIKVTEQDFWQKNLAEFAMDCQILEPLTALLSLQILDNGCLIKGNLTGLVQLPCNRCTTPCAQAINVNFEEFEEFEVDDLEDSWIIEERGHFYLDLASFLWEQFILAMPVQILCSKDCKGLCSNCGANLNHESCNCSKTNLDPRLAPLQNLKIQAKK